MSNEFSLGVWAFAEDAQRARQDKIERVGGFSGQVKRLASRDGKPFGFLARGSHGAARHIFQEFNGPEAGSDIEAHVGEHAHFDSLFIAFRSSCVFQIRMTSA